MNEIEADFQTMFRMALPWGCTREEAKQLRRFFFNGYRAAHTMHTIEIPQMSDAAAVDTKDAISSEIRIFYAKP